MHRRLDLFRDDHDDGLFDAAAGERLQPFAVVIGSRNKPKAERTPKPVSAIRQPAMMTTVGLRLSVSTMAPSARW